MLFLDQISVLSRTFPFLSFLSVPSTNLSCTKSQASPESDDPSPPLPLPPASPCCRKHAAEDGELIRGRAALAAQALFAGMLIGWSYVVYCDHGVNRGVSAAGAVVGTKFGENEACANVCRSLRRRACARHTSLQPCSVRAHRHRHTSNHF